ncbi:MAG: hypothetical protein UD025_04030 [Senegalimassilia anaerobia]|uniref:hypothetical protein n=1 Tax=Senegalimassilia anaerobia TaxID=1473216 RepID=UPI002E78B093|nr:hypothetical protein [Senegalimassilia anaerobia]MEE0303474.1 hypothetical protein [Senegalimassilia anaerobia]
MKDLKSGIEHLKQAKAHMSKANGIMSNCISKLKALEEENAELRDELDDWKGNAEGFQPDSYMKLPVDADGIAIRPGDKIYFNGDPEGFALKCIAVGCSPCPVEFVDWEETGTTAWEEGSAFTHRQPKPLLLGADGVPLEVGDTVYYDEDVRPLEVVRLHAGDGGYCTVGIKDSEGRIISADAPRLSHKSPDSWEKLADDVADFDAFEYCVDVLEIDTSDFSEAQERRTMKADVIRRAKKLAGIEEARND